MAKKTVEEETKTPISTTSPLSAELSAEIPSASILTNLIPPDEIPLDLTGIIRYNLLFY